MIMFIANFMLAIVMAELLAGFSLQALTLSMLAAFFLTWPLRKSFGEDTYHKRVVALTNLTAFFVYELVVSSFRVAYDVVTPPILAKPRFLTVPLDAKTDTEILLTANLISLTPGSLSVEISPDRKHLLVHTMFPGQSPDEARAELKDGMERRVVEALRQ